MTVDCNLSWYHSDKVFNRKPPEYIPILDERRMTIAGVRIKSLDWPVDFSLQGQIMNAIKKLTFNVKFKRPLTGSDWEKSKF